MTSNYSTPFTYEALKALEEAIIQGVQTVKYSDKEVTYRTLKEMMQIRDIIRKQLKIDGVGCGEETGIFGGRKKNPRHTKGLVD